ncbi:MAG: RNA polymerase subunit sigma-70 [Flavobacteriaceae bacterium]|nr:RNA polymerase subunit sigma-70 [Flavobacteriaceae bacterium]
MSSHMLDPEQWVDRYSDYLYNYTIVRVNNHLVAQDIISETFLAGLKSKDNFKGEASERTWLTAILKRKIIDHYRKKNSKKGKAEVHINYRDEDSEGDWLEERVEDPFDKTAEDTLENEELGVAIFNCLETLKDKQKEIFKKKTIEGFDTDAICNEYNITPSNLWVIIHRARKSMAECLEKSWL